MKKLAIVLLISLLFQSCFSYTRALDFNAGEVQVNQDVKIYKNNGTERKGQGALCGRRSNCDHLQ